MNAPQATDRLSFSGFEIHPEKRELRRNGRLVALEPKALDLLCYLIEHRDRVVSKRELLDRIWPDVIVVDSSLTRLVSVLRKTLRDASEEEREHIRNVPRTGYRFVVPVTRSAARTDDVSGADLGALESEFPFVGRAESLARLEAAWTDVVKSRGRLVLLTGPAGIGKTRLAHEFESRARAKGACPLLSWCYEGEGAPPYWPWALWIRAYLRCVGADVARRALGSDATDLLSLVPEVGEISAEAGASATASEGEFRFFYSVASFFRRAAREQPLLLMIEDVQWADRSTLRLLSFVARELHDAPVLLLATTRNEGPGDGRVFSELHAALRRPEGSTIALHALRSDEVGTLIRARLGSNVDPMALSAIEERSEGNPLFVSELVRSLESAETTVDVEQVRALIPTAVQGVVMDRVLRSSEPCRELLELGAVLGREFSLRLMRRTAIHDLERSLEEALARGILCEHRARPGFFRFGHALLAEILRGGLTPARRLNLHRQLASALEQESDRDAVAAELAEHHMLLARSGAPAEPAIASATHAAELALRAFAYSEAARHYQRALEATTLCPAPDPKQQCELLLAEADALTRAGQRDEALTRIERAATLAREGAWPELLGRSALALAPGIFSTVGSDDPGGRFESSRYDERLVAALEEALQCVPEPMRSLRAMLLARYAIAQIGGMPEAERARVAGLALQVAEQTRDPSTLGYAIGARHTTLCRPQDFQLRWELIERMRARATAGGDLELSVMQRVYWISLLLEVGDLVGVDREIDMCLEYARALRLPRSRWYAESYRAMRICMQGRFEEASAQIEPLVIQAEHAGDPSAVLMLRMRAALARSEIESGPAVEALMRAGIQLHPQMRSFHAGLAKIYVDTLRFDEARRELDALAADDFAHIPHNEGWSLTMALLADVVTALGDRARAARLYQLLHPAAGRFIVIVFAACIFGSADRLLGKLSHVCGKIDLAADHFERALDIERAAGARPWLGWTLHDFALLLANRGHAQDLERSRAYLAESRAIASELAMVGLAAAIDRTSADLTARAAH